MMSQLWRAKPRLSVVLLVMALACAVLTATAWSRGTEYDEDYSVFLASGTPRPEWPTGVFRAGDVRHFFRGSSTPERIALDLRRTDVHPPLYFWAVAAWRQLAGQDLFTTRLLSVLFSLVALAAVGGIARLLAVPPVAAMLVTLGCYGFAYTGAIARGFACAQALSLLGAWALLAAERRGRVAGLFGAGLLLGLATFANYLAAFAGAGALLWLLLRQWRRPRLWLAAGLGFALVLPADLWFFLAQKGSRVDQFPPFRLIPGLARLAQYAAANVFGGLPLYVGGAARLALGGALAALLVGLVALIALRFRRLGAPGTRALPVLAALAVPVGLVLLGLVFDNTPIELRYLAFATPFLALLTAGALATLPRSGPALLAGLLAIQAVSLAGMITRPETMQPQQQTARAAAALAGPDGVVVLPRGNDGVGIVAAVINESPDWLHLLVVPRGATPEQIRAAVAQDPKVVVAELGLDGDSRATLPVIAEAFAGDRCWCPSGTGPHVAAYDRTC